MFIVQRLFTLENTEVPKWNTCVGHTALAGKAVKCDMRQVEGPPADLKFVATATTGSCVKLFPTV